MMHTPIRKHFSGGNRKRAGVKRYPCGQIVHADRKPIETEEQILATVTAQPHRRGAANPRDERLGSVLGRLNYVGGADGISGEQYRAGTWFAEHMLRYTRLVTGSLPRYPSMIAERIAGAMANAPEPSQEEIDRLKRDQSAIQEALADRGILYDGNRALVAVCVMDRYADDLGLLRTALNAVAKARGLT